MKGFDDGSIIFDGFVIEGHVVDWECSEFWVFFIQPDETFFDESTASFIDHG